MSLVDLVGSLVNGKVAEVQKGGRLLVSVSTGGTTSTYQIPANGIGATELAELGAELLGLIEEIQVETPDISETDLVKLLVAQFRGYNTNRPDFGGLER